MTSKPDNKMPRRELLMLLVLMLVQFTGIMDLIIVAPLELPLTRAFHQDAAWFSRTILAFTVSSFACGLAGASIVDRFDRKHVVLTLFAGFGLGQLACALAGSPQSFVAARMFAGAFAGLFSASASAIVGDAVPLERRGMASGIMNSAYALAFIVGVPLGLHLSNHFSWHAPFYLMAAQAAVVVLAGVFLLPSARSHLSARDASRPAIRTVLRDPNQLRALGLNGALMFSAYAVTPFLAKYLVDNLHFPEASIPTFYLVGGLFTLVAGVVLGIVADRKGHARVFGFVALASIGATLWITTLHTSSIVLAIFVTTLFMATVTGRTVPALAMALTSVSPELRGAFMSLNSAVQQLSLGLGAMAAGAILVEDGHSLQRFEWCGALSIAGSLLCVYFARGLRPSARTRDVGAAPDTAP